MWQLTSVNPYTQEINATFDTLTNEELDNVIDTAHEAYLSWKDTTFDERKALFLKMADSMDSKNAELAELETKEMWSLLHFSKAVITGTANLIRRYANNTERILWDKTFAHDGMTGKYRYDSLWVVYGIAPWNFPFNQLLRAAVANIMAGNTTIYKHASNVPMCLAAIQDLFDEAGFPTWVFTKLFISSRQSEQILAHKHVIWVNLTWSEDAGSAIWSLAGKYVKPSVLELGGNDAFVLTDHKNTSAMAASAVTCRLSNGWQRCNGSKRFIIPEKYYDEFVDYMGKHMQTMQRWDPMLATTQLPPISSTKLRDEIHDQVQRTLAQWARLITWWEILGDKGQFYAATVLADVTPGMVSYEEEVFGPVASIIKSKNIEESIALANNSEFGLSATVWWDDIEQCKAIADRLIWWMIFINNPAWSKASLPFWWVKKSWYGKENGPQWLRAFTNKKAIVYTVA